MFEVVRTCMDTRRAGVDESCWVRLRSWTSPSQGRGPGMDFTRTGVPRTWSPRCTKCDRRKKGRERRVSRRSGAA